VQSSQEKIIEEIEEEEEDNEVRMLRLKEQLQDYPAFRDSYINECLHLPKD